MIRLVIFSTLLLIAILSQQVIDILVSFCNQYNNRCTVTCFNTHFQILIMFIRERLYRDSPLNVIIRISTGR